MTHQIEDDDYDHHFPEEDDTFYKQVDEIEARSPIKPIHNRPIPLSQSEPLLRATPSFPSYAPVTPPNSHSARSQNRSAHRPVSKALADHKLRSPMPPRRLFSEPTSFSNKGQPLRLFITDDDESDEERGEVSRILTDTEESPLFEALSPATSSSSPGSASGLSDWSLVSESSSFSSSCKKRNSDASHTSADSPSKYRKVGTNQQNASYRAQSGVYPTPTGSQAPVVVDDVFNSPQTHPVPKEKAMQHDPEPSPRSLTTPLDNFLSGPIGIDLDVSIIAHDARIQALLDKEQISWGTQFELARGVTKDQWTWDEVERNIGKLRGPNVQSAYRVRNTMLNKPQQSSSGTLELWYVHILYYLSRLCFQHSIGTGKSWIVNNWPSSKIVNEALDLWASGMAIGTGMVAKSNNLLG